MRLPPLCKVALELDSFLFMYTRVSQIAGVFQKMIFESCTLLHIIPFAKIIGPVEKKIDKSEFSPIFS